MSKQTVVSHEALARALYETDAGSNGYPPLHKSIPWRELVWREMYLDRAREIIRKLSVPSRGEPTAP